MRDIDNAIHTIHMKRLQKKVELPCNTARLWQFNSNPKKGYLNLPMTTLVLIPGHLRLKWFWDDSYDKNRSPPSLLP